METFIKDMYNECTYDGHMIYDPVVIVTVVIVAMSSPKVLIFRPVLIF